MRTKNLLLTAVGIGLAVVAGLLSVGGTWALWNASAHAGAGTVQAATFDVTVNDRSLADNGWKVSIGPEKPGAKLSPTQKVYVALTVTNATNASGPFTLEMDPDTPSTVRTESALRNYVTVRSVPVETGRCADASYPKGFFTDPPPARIEKGGSYTYCFEVALKTDAPSTSSSKNVGVDVQLSMTQL